MRAKGIGRVWDCYHDVIKKDLPGMIVFFQIGYLVPSPGFGENVLCEKELVLVLLVRRPPLVRDDLAVVGQFAGVHQFDIAAELRHRPQCCRNLIAKRIAR
jgi:hypothetical protein